MINKPVKIKCKIKNIRPMLQHRFPEEDNPDGKSGRKTKILPAKEEAIKGLYKNEKGMCCVPSRHIKAAMIKSASNFKLEGKLTYKDLIKGGIFIEPTLIPIKPQKWIVDRQPEVVNRGSRVMRARPLFEKWEVEFVIYVVDDRARIDEVKNILEYAGLYKAIGDRRPEFGTFEVIKFTK